MDHAQKVAKTDQGYEFRCSPPCNFASTGWGTKKAAEERAAQHANEHDTGQLMEPIHEFRLRVEGK